MDQKKLKNRVETLQNGAFFVFVPAAGIAIFSDNGMFEAIAFIAAIVFGVASYIYTLMTVK